MKDEQLFLDICDKIYYEAANEIKDDKETKDSEKITKKKEKVDAHFKTYLKPFLDIEDYDAFITCFDILLNRIALGLYELIKQVHELSDLPHCINLLPHAQEDIVNYLDLCMELSVDIFGMKAFIEDYANQIVKLSRQYFKRYRAIKCPVGFNECLESIKEACLSAILPKQDDPFWRKRYYNSNDEVEWWERNGSLNQNSDRFLEKVLLMYALRDRKKISKYIKSEISIKRYDKAQKFIVENSINLPDFYVLTWLLMYYYEEVDETERKRRNDEECKNELKKILLHIPNLYIDILKRFKKYPSSDRIGEYDFGIPRESKNDNGTEGKLKLSEDERLHIPFEYMFPSFIIGEELPQLDEHWLFPREQPYIVRKCKSQKRKRKIVGNFIHPMMLLRLPFVNIKIRADIRYLIENLTLEATLDFYTHMERGELTFPELLNKLLDTNNITPAKFLLENNISSTTFYRYKNYEYKSKPMKINVHKIAIGLKLDVKYAEFFYATAGYHLSKTDPLDKIVRSVLGNHAKCSIIVADEKIMEYNKKYTKKSDNCKKLPYLTCKNDELEP